MNFVGDLLSLTTIGLTLNWSLRLLALFVIPRNRAPSSAMAWLMIVFLVPIPGFILFLLFGSTKLPQERRDLQARVKQILIAIGTRHVLRHDHVTRKYERTARLAEELAHLPLSNITNYELHTDYDATLARIADDIRKAQKSVYIEYYIFVLDKTTEPIIAALEGAKQRGVDVKVIYDTAATVVQGYRYVRPMLRRLKKAGVEVVGSLPVHLFGTGYMRPDLRNHRKIVAIDGVIGYIGSQNIIDKRYHRRDALYYEEVVVRIEGDVVPQLEAVFGADWYAETKNDIAFPAKRRLTLRGGTVQTQLLPSGPGYEDENNLKVFNELIYTAEKSITIVSPYFIPDVSMMIAIVTAAKRGVKVRIVNSQIIDQLLTAHAQRSYYEELLRAGVSIYLCNSPAFVHTKLMTIDGEVSIIGSSNMDIRSFELDHEITLISYDSAFTCGLEAIAKGYIARATMVDKEKWLARPRYLQLLDNIARLTSSFQ